MLTSSLKRAFNLGLVIEAILLNIFIYICSIFPLLSSFTVFIIHEYRGNHIVCYKARLRWGWFMHRFMVSYIEMVSMYSVLINVITLLYQHKAVCCDSWDFGQQKYTRYLVCPPPADSLPSIKLCSASYRRLSLAPGGGHCIITVQLQEGKHTTDSRW